MVLYFSFKIEIALLNCMGQALGVLAHSCPMLFSVQVMSLASEAGPCSAAAPCDLGRWLSSPELRLSHLK